MNSSLRGFERLSPVKKTMTTTKNSTSYVHNSEVDPPSPCDRPGRLQYFTSWLKWGKTEETTVRPPGNKDGSRRVVQEVSGIEYSHFDKGLKVYEVRAKKNRKMRNDQQQLDKTGPSSFFDEKEQETIRVTGKRCKISRDYNTITVIDDVVVKSQNDMTVTSNLLKYDSRLRQFHTQSPSKFLWKTMIGKAKGFVYKIEEEMLILPEEPQIQYINRGSENRQPIVVKGMRGVVDRKNGFAYFDDNVEVTQGRDRINADRIEVAFTPVGNDVEKIIARNQTSI